MICENKTMGKVIKHSYPSTQKPYSKSHAAIGGRIKKAPVYKSTLMKKQANSE